MDRNLIYFDNASTSLYKLDEVYKALSERGLANPSRSFYKESMDSLKVILKAKSELADLLNVEVDDISLNSGLTMCSNLALRSLFCKSDHVISTVYEHNSVVRPLHDIGLEVDFVSINDDLTLKYEEFDKYLKSNTVAVIVNHVSNVTGHITDLDRVHEFCQKNNLIMIVDSAQGFGYLDLDISKYKNSIFLITFHKGMHGPYGVGAIVKNGEFKFNKCISGGSGGDTFNRNLPDVFPEIFEVGTPNMHSINAAIPAIVAFKNSSKDRFRKLKELSDYLKKEISKIEKIEAFKLDSSPIPIVSIRSRTIDTRELSHLLYDKYMIATRGAYHCAPLAHEALGTKDTGLIRISLSFDNTKQEIDELIRALNLLL